MWQHRSLSHKPDCLFFREGVSKRKYLSSGGLLSSASPCGLWKLFLKPSKLPTELLKAGAYCCGSGNDVSPSDSALGSCDKFGRHLNISRGSASLLMRDGTVSVKFKKKVDGGENIYVKEHSATIDI